MMAVPPKKVTRSQPIQQAMIIRRLESIWIDYF